MSTDSTGSAIRPNATQNFGAVEQRSVAGPAGNLAVHLQGPANGAVVLMAHSILSASMMWEVQADVLAREGFRVLRVDTRGHGASAAGRGPFTMDDLAADSVAVLDQLGVGRAHYVGLSLGGMSGFGLGIRYPDRWLSLCLCDARADAPAGFAAPWDERIAIAEREGCGALAQSTAERWFGRPFMEAHPELAERFLGTIAATSVDGFVGSARAIQGLDYLSQVDRIALPTTLVVGANDGPLPQAMRDLQGLIKGAALAVIDGAGHLPNIDQPEAFNQVLLQHLRVVAN